MTAALEGGEWSAARPGRTLPLGKIRYPFYRRLGGPQGRSRWAVNLVTTGIRSRTVQSVAQSLYRLSYRTHNKCVYIYIYIITTAPTCFGASAPSSGNFDICIWGGGVLVQRLRCCATNRKVAGSIPDGVIGTFHCWHNPSDRTLALGSTQPLTEMSTRSISWG